MAMNQFPYKKKEVFDVASRKKCVFSIFYFVGTSNRTPCKVKDARVPVGQKIHVYITSVTSPNDLFCQLTETSAELDDLMNEIEEHYRPLGEDEQAYTGPQVNKMFGHQIAGRIRDYHKKIGCSMTHTRV